LYQKTDKGNAFPAHLKTPVLRNARLGFTQPKFHSLRLYGISTVTLKKR